MTLLCGPEESPIRLSGIAATTTIRSIRIATEPERRSPATMIASYDLNEVMAAVRGWQEKAASTPDPAAGEAYRRSAAQFERLVTLSLDTPPIR